MNDTLIICISYIVCHLRGLQQSRPSADLDSEYQSDLLLLFYMYILLDQICDHMCIITIHFTLARAAFGLFGLY